MSNQTIRSATIYVSPQLARWLSWLAQMEAEGEENKAFKVTADSIAEKILREAILQMQPDIQQLESEYWTARNKLDDEMVAKLKPTGMDSKHEAAPKDDLPA